MQWSLEFHYKSPGSARPEDVVQDQQLVFENEGRIPIPNVGDSVSYLYNDKMVSRKVLTRHFGFYGPGCCVIVVVVTDMTPEEASSRVKE